MKVSPVKTGKLRSLLTSEGCGGVLLSTPANFAWYTGGADNRVDHSDPLGVASILVTRDAHYVVTSVIEAQRMRSEQTPDIEVVEHPWYESRAPLLGELMAGEQLCSDHPLTDAHDVSQQIAPMRRVLDPDDITRYMEVGRDAREAISEAASLADPGMDEAEAVSILVAASRKRGLFNPVAAAAGERRAALYRHAIPGRGVSLGGRVSFGFCAERGGLYANMTRTVFFEDPTPEVAGRFDACQQILSGMKEATLPGRTLAEVFADCRKLYRDVGSPEEWRRHHQGGMTGYASREVIATPASEVQVETGQAYAWNPTISGAKAEETFVLTESGSQTMSGTVRT